VHRTTAGALCACSALVAALAPGAGCSGSGGATPAGCGDQPACGEFARCLDASCVADAAPIAALTSPSDPRALVLLRFDGSASSDPDASLGDAVEAFRWSFSSLDGACAAPVVASTEALASVRFGCAGRFGVELVVADRLGLESPPATAEVVVSAYAGASLVRAGSDQVVEHRCSGTPLVCTTEGDPALIASLDPAAAPAGEVAFHWAAEGPLDAHRRVSFLPSADVRDPAVRIEVDGTEVVGDWVFHVSAHDAAGPLGEAATRVSVRNRPPVLAATVTAVAVDHAFSGGLYAATARASRWQDPDGDPLSPAGISGSADCASFSLGADGAAEVRCQRAFTGTLALEGFAGTHRVDLRVKDPWATAAAGPATAITVRNRPLAAWDASATAGETGCEYSRCCGAGDTCDGPICSPHPVSAILGLADPDGDPVEVVWHAGSDFVSSPAVCLPGSCAGTGTLPRYSGCTGSSGALTGVFEATDGLTAPGPSSLTVSYTY
jgi:hypothetical protein